MTDAVEEAGAAGAIWLAARLPWTTELSNASGTALDEPAARMQPESVVATMARVTRQIHALERDGCPELSIDDLVDRAHDRAAGEVIDAAAFAAPYRRYTPLRLFEILAQQRALIAERETDVVATHGALRPAGVFVSDGIVNAVQGATLCGASDRYRDLAVTCAALAELIAPGAVPAFLDEYGLERPDPLRLDFFVLLSQFG